MSMCRSREETVGFLHQKHHDVRAYRRSEDNGPNRRNPRNRNRQFPFENRLCYLLVVLAYSLTYVNPIYIGIGPSAFLGPVS